MRRAGAGAPARGLPRPSFRRHAPACASIPPATCARAPLLQALNLLNSNFAIQQAGFFAERLKKEAGDEGDTFPEHLQPMLHLRQLQPQHLLQRREHAEIRRHLVALAGEVGADHLPAVAAVARAMSVGDVVATALATAAFQAVTGRTHAAHDDRTPLGDGWQNILRQFATHPT